MTLKTVNGHRGVVMANSAKMLGIGRAYRLVVVVVDSVALHAVFQTVFFRAYSFIHGFIALVQQQFHMMRTHVFGIFHALIAFAFGDFGQGRSRVRGDG
jgi:hypothetical protein